jgi:GST-like protein
MLKFYFHRSPNPMKVALLLEELGVKYEVFKTDIFKGEQHTTEFRALNPNGKVPVIVDGDTVVFDSNAILLYLAEKNKQFLPTNEKERTTALSWLFFVATGLSPFSGQAVHFLRAAPQDEGLSYARNRYLKEVERHYQVLDKHLEKHHYLAGDTYSIADTALWGWANAATYIFGEKGVSDYSNVHRLYQEISARPAALRALALKEKMVFKTEMDEEARRAMFVHTK